MSSPERYEDEDDVDLIPRSRNEDDFFEHVTDKYFPYGLDDESVDGEPFTPTPGAW